VYAARGKELGQERVNTGLFQRPDTAWWYFTNADLHKFS